MVGPNSLECRLASASLAAYSIVWNPSTGHWELPTNAPGYQAIQLSAPPICFADGVENINAGFVGETTDGWVFVTFRGTLPPFEGDFWAWVDDWLQDFEAGPVPWTVNGATFGNVEGGFATALLALWSFVLAALGTIKITNKKGVIITGHSKGGAMAFLAASLFKTANPDVLTEVCCFAPPLTCDRTFRDNYNGLHLRPFTVRYQNEYDLVPFMPWYPTLDVLASVERQERVERANLVVTSKRRLKAFENDYVPIGIIRYITTSCSIEYGDKAEQDAWNDLQTALWALEFTTIAKAHSMAGRYYGCICKFGPGGALA